MRDRLIELLYKVECKGEESFLNCPERKNGGCRSVNKLEVCQVGAIADFLLANGVIAPPCNVDDTVYCLVDAFEEPMEAKIYSITIQNAEVIMRCGVKGYYGVSFMAKDFGKKFFKAKEEAEQALKEREQ